MSADPPPLFRELVLNPITPALQLGAATGVAGLAFGGVAGLFKSAHPVLFSATAGAQCFFLGSTYFYGRGVMLAAAGRPTSLRSREIAASGVAGCFAGAASGALRGRANIVPGAIMIGLLGLAGQVGVHAISDYSSTKRKPLGQRLVEWSPLRALPDDEYEAILEEKLVKIEAEISILDQQIADLRAATQTTGHG